MVIALILLSGVIIFNVLDSPASYDVEFVPADINETYSTQPSSEYYVTEAFTDVSVEPYTTFYSDGRVNINTADMSQLQTLKGIGASKAQAIIDYRNENGLFSSVSDLLNVSGIGQKTLDGIISDITV